MPFGAVAGAFSRQHTIMAGRKRRQSEPTFAVGDGRAIDRIGHGQPSQDLAGLLVSFAFGVDKDPGDRLTVDVQHAPLDCDSRLERELAEVAPFPFRDTMQFAG